jgi:hypothetical protein
MIHLNQGCEGTALHQMQLKRSSSEMELPMMTDEGNMADEREFAESRITRLIDLFVTQTLGLKKST